ncbi:MAG: sodium-dependent transporter [Synergistaceae bacterium]|nr:sodium-dependent transporter [Synergistaceae bacterium]
MQKKDRESLGSRLGFIFLSAGCAIGLGNVWRFPYLTGRYGGAVFVLIYLVFLVCLAMPVMVMEFAVGRASRRSIIGSFRVLQPKGMSWSIFGYFGLAGNYILMMFYTTVTGWMLAYTWYSLTGRLEDLTPGQVGAFFGSVLGNPWGLSFWLFAAVGIGSLICTRGLQQGVERATKVMMYGLLISLLLLAVRSITLPGAEKGIEFYLKPSLNRLLENGVWNTIYAALGQAFFTLSLGIGSMAIFGSYIGRDQTLLGESLLVTALDSFVALSAGFIIFPACFAYGIEAGAGPGLIFVTLPTMFNNMPHGRLWGTLFFLFMSFAAMTTVVAVFEFLIASSMEAWGWSRRKAGVFNFSSIFILSLPCVSGFNVWSDFAPLGKGTTVLDLEDFIVSNNLLPLGAIVYLLFCCTRWGWGWEKFTAEADAGKGPKISKALRAYCTYVIPTAIAVIFLFGYFEKFFAN